MSSQHRQQRRQRLAGRRGKSKALAYAMQNAVIRSDTDSARELAYGLAERQRDAQSTEEATK